MTYVRMHTSSIRRLSSASLAYTLRLAALDCRPTGLRKPPLAAGPLAGCTSSATMSASSSSCIPYAHMTLLSAGLSNADAAAVETQLEWCSSSGVARFSVPYALSKTSSGVHDTLLHRLSCWRFCAKQYLLPECPTKQVAFSKQLMHVMSALRYWTSACRHTALAASVSPSWLCKLTVGPSSPDLSTLSALHLLCASAASSVGLHLLTGAGSRALLLVTALAPLRLLLTECSCVLEALLRRGSGVWGLLLAERGPVLGNVGSRSCVSDAISSSACNLTMCQLEEVVLQNCKKCALYAALDCMAACSTHSAKDSPYIHATTLGCQMLLQDVVHAAYLL